MRVRDGAELGLGRPRVPPRRHGPPAGGDRRRAPARVGAAGSRRLPRRAAHAVPAAIAEAGVDPADVIGIATDFTASTPLPVLADGTPLCELPEFRDRPHAYVKLWKHHAAQPQADRINAVAAERGEPWLARYGGLHLQRVGVRQGAAAARGGSRDLRADGPLGRGGRLDRLAAVRRVRPQRLHRRLQGHLAGRRLSVARLRSGAEPRLRRLRQVEARPRDRRSSATAPAASRREAAAWTGLPEGIAVAVGNVDAHVTAPAARAVEAGQMLAIMGTSTCHVMNHDQLVEVPGMCGVVDGGIVAGSFGYEAGQSGVGDIFAWYVDNQVPGRYFDEAAAPPASRSTTTSPTSPSPNRPGAHGLVALDWINGNRSVLVDAVAVRADPRPDAPHPRRAGLPGVARGDGVRRPDDRRDVRRVRRARARVRRRRRPAEEPSADAAVRRRAAPADLDDRLRAGPGAGLGDPRRRRRRRLPRRPRRERGDGPRRRARSTRPTRAPPTSTTGCTRSTACCTTTSAAAATTS